MYGDNRELRLGNIYSAHFQCARNICLPVSAVEQRHSAETL